MLYPEELRRGARTGTVRGSGGGGDADSEEVRARTGTARGSGGGGDAYPEEVRRGARAVAARGNGTGGAGRPWCYDATSQSSGSTIDGC